MSNEKKKKKTSFYLFESTMYIDNRKTTVKKKKKRRREKGNIKYFPLVPQTQYYLAFSPTKYIGTTTGIYYVRCTSTLRQQYCFFCMCSTVTFRGCYTFFVIDIIV